MIAANPANTAHAKYNEESISLLVEKISPDTNAPTPIPISNDMSIVLKPIATFPSFAKSAVQANIVGIFTPIDSP